jgi:hypothetical protein
MCSRVDSDGGFAIFADSRHFGFAAVGRDRLCVASMRCARGELASDEGERSGVHRCANEQSTTVKKHQRGDTQ